MEIPQNVTTETAQKVEAWIAAKKRLNELRKELNSAECALANATNYLGKYLVPVDTIITERNNEWFNIWWGNGILRVRTKRVNDFEVEWLKEPTGKQAINQGI